MIIENNRYLGGHLIGIGKIRANGELEYQELKNPIHNKIVSVGLDHLFQFSGSTYPDFGYASSNDSAAGVLWASVSGRSGYGYRAGALHYMAFGSSSAATAFSDSDLGNRLVDYSSVKISERTSPYNLNGTRINSFGNYSFKLTHKSAAVAETVTVNEIGWYGAYGTNSSNPENKVLFARVVLPSPITFNPGEFLVTTYQLDETNSNTIATTDASFFGLKDSNGNDLQYEKKLVRYQTTYSESYGWSNANYLGEPKIDVSGGGRVDFGQSYPYLPPYVVSPASNAYSRFSFSYSTDPTKTLPADGGADYSGLVAFSATGTSGENYDGQGVTYTGVGSTNKYRDKKFITGIYNPNMIGNPSAYTDIYYLHINGMAYRFGYYDDGVWVPQAWRKYANQKVTFTFRTRYSTEDTTMS